MLDEALSDLIPKIKDYGFPVVISDNASKDLTLEVVKRHKLEYSQIYYYSHTTNIGPDKNFEFTLKKATDYSEYAWLLGDSYRIVKEELSSIVSALEKRCFSLVVVNSFYRIKNRSSKIYTNSSVLLDEIGWHMTMISTLIFSRELINQDKFSRYYNTNFIQMGVVFEYLSEKKDARVFFYSKNCVFGTKISKKEDSWLPSTFKIFARNWTNFVLSLPPDIPLELKLLSIKKHNVKMKIFSIRKLYFLKKNGWLKYERDVFPYKEFIPYATITPWILISIISRFPYVLTLCIKWPLQICERAYMLMSGDYWKIQKSK